MQMAMTESLRQASPLNQKAFETDASVETHQSVFPSVAPQARRVELREVHLLRDDRKNSSAFSF